MIAIYTASFRRPKTSNAFLWDTEGGTEREANTQHYYAAIRNHMPVPDAKLNALVTLVKLVRERGDAKQGTIQNVLAAGHQKEQVMELLVSIAQKTISDYVDYISPTPP